MYESYSWPGAYSLKYEIKLFTKRIINLVNKLVKHPEKK